MVVEPLRKLFRSGADTFKWTVEAEESFKELKGGLVHSAPFTLFDPSLPTLVSTDASDYGLGGVLSQLHPDNTQRVVTFTSLKLSAAERKYSTVEKEALACVWAVE